MELYVVDDHSSPGFVGSQAGPIAGFFRPGYIPMTNSVSMVNGVLARAGRNSIRRLHIMDHGNPNGIQFGDDRITISSLQDHRATLRRLNGHFTNDGSVYLHHCHVGQNGALLRSLADIFGVNVYAGTSFSVAGLFNLGDERRCNAERCWPSARPYSRVCSPE